MPRLNGVLEFLWGKVMLLGRPVGVGPHEAHLGFLRV